mmetsp:Transcript_23030/g.36996  ORF Transcript_23030/g.36996 Transcript_23030/m.36996 type:complete len:87 (+) Transcript_23030:54-314(+)
MRWKCSYSKVLSLSAAVSRKMVCAYIIVPTTLDAVMDNIRLFCVSAHDGYERTISSGNAATSSTIKETRPTILLLSLPPRFSFSLL